MIPIDFPEKNFTFTKPADMTDEQCNSLHVCKTTDQEGFPISISCWQPTPEELAEVNRTGQVWLIVTGNGHPPVSIAGFNPLKPEPDA